MTVLDDDGVRAVERRLNALPRPDWWRSADYERINASHFTVEFRGNVPNDVVTFIIEAHEHDVRDLLDTIADLKTKLDASHELIRRLEGQRRVG